MSNQTRSVSSFWFSCLKLSDSFTSSQFCTQLNKENPKKFCKNIKHMVIGQITQPVRRDNLSYSIGFTISACSC